MSRTDVHTPYWVKARSRSWHRHFVEVHDHETTGCDLADYLTDRLYWRRDACQMQFVFADGNVHCGCNLCTGQRARKRARRRERAELRAKIRTIMKTGKADIDTVDIPPPGPVRGW